MKLKSVLITGVYGGIGIACAKLFSEAGWRVVGTDKAFVTSSYVDEFIQADLYHATEIETLFKKIDFDSVPLYGVVNNAAFQVNKPFLETSLDDFEKVWRINVLAAFLVVQRAFKHLEKTHGAVVNVSSVHALATSQGVSAYAASKGALMSLTRALALECASSNVRVNAVLPGAVDTQMLRDGLQRGHLGQVGDEAALTELGNRHPLQRVGKPSEIARAVFFLLNDQESSFITGQTLVVDGGALARLSTE